MNTAGEKHTPEYPIVTKPNSDLPKSFKFCFFAVFALFCIFGYINFLRYLDTEVPGIDFCNYYIAAFAAEELSLENMYEGQDSYNATVALFEKAVASKQESLIHLTGAWMYWLKRTPTTYHFNATPFLYTILSIFRFDNYMVSLWTYRFFSLACYVLAIWWLCQRYGYSAFSTIIFLLLLTSWFKPFQSSIALSNVDTLQLGCLMLFLYLSSIYSLTFAGGILLGLIIVFKPNIVFIVLMLCASWIANRRFRTLFLTGFGAIGGVAIAVLSSSVFFGSMRCWLYWPGRLKLFVDDAFTTSDNCATARIIWDFYGIKISPYLAVFFLCVAGIVVWLCRRLLVQTALQDREDAQNAKMNFQEESLMISIGFLIYLLSGPVVWEHYFVYAVPAILITFTSFTRVEVSNRRELLIRRSLIVLAFIGLSTQSIIILPGNVAAIVLNSSALILFTLALRELWRLKKYNQKTVAIL